MSDQFATYKRADGDQVEDFAWVTETDWFDDYDEPIEVIEEVWTLKSRRTLLLGNLTRFCPDCDDDFQISELPGPDKCPHCLLADAQDDTGDVSTSGQEFGYEHCPSCGSTDVKQIEVHTMTCRVCLAKWWPGEDGVLEAML